MAERAKEQGVAAWPGSLPTTEQYRQKGALASPLGESIADAHSAITSDVVPGDRDAALTAAIREMNPGTIDINLFTSSGLTDDLLTQFSANKPGNALNGAKFPGATKAILHVCLSEDVIDAS